MKTLQVVLAEKLLKDVDRVAMHRRVNRTAVIRQALHEHLARQAAVDLEEREGRGYQTQPQRLEEYLPWEEAAVWPAE